MSSTRSDLLNLLALPPLERRVIVYLTREGPSDCQSLAQALDLAPAEVQEALDSLVKRGGISIAEDGLAQVTLGKTRRRTLPARLWPALLASSRLYSTQEIAVLNTALPILQFARAKMSEFADHGPGHVLRVKSFATQLGSVAGLSEKEQHMLRAAAFFHDVGNVLDRGRHHIISQETVQRLTASGELPFSNQEAELVGLLCRWHRKEYDPDRIDHIHGEAVRTGLLASILRVSDAMDIDHRRSDYNERFSRVLEFYYPSEIPFWTSLEEILGVRIHCRPEVNLQVFAIRELQDNIQFNMLRGDLEGTPLAWGVERVLVSNGPDPNSLAQGTFLGVAKGYGRKKALLAYPFDGHSLIMAAISRRNLKRAGWQVEMLCFPDTANGPSWLWSEGLAEYAPENYDLLVAIGDRPDPEAREPLLNRVRIWRTAGVPISILNRHEANWTRLPELLEQGVEIHLGADWAYFWGSEVQQQDLFWGHIAALCTRDPTQSTVSLSGEDEVIVQGLLKSVLDQAGGSNEDVAGWVRLSEQILRRIEANDSAYFSDQAFEFRTKYTVAPRAPEVDGQVLRFHEAPGNLPQAYYWVLEEAIEKHGRAPERGIQFKTPYAVATWQEGEVLELLAISHWREESAIPIRLLYPSDMGPPPEGNESTVRVSLPREQADGVVQALIDACNGVEKRGPSQQDARTQRADNPPGNSQQ